MTPRWLLTVAFAAAALPARAQIRANTVEISPFYGRLFGGEFAAGSNDLFAQRVDVADADNWGVRVGYNLTEMWQFEARASRADTHFISHENGGVFGPEGERLGDLRIDYFLGYATINFGHRRWVPYFTIGAGAARLQPSDTAAPSHDSTRFTGSLGGGLKVFVNRHFGIRADGRAYSTLLDHDDNCGDSHHHCDNRHYFTNGEVGGGLILAF